MSTNPDVTTDFNYSEKIVKVKNSLSKLLEVSSATLLIASQLADVYILSPLPTNALREINSLFYDFLWNSKGDKIKRDVMINDYKWRLTD